MRSCEMMKLICRTILICCLNKSKIYHSRDFSFSWCHLFLFKNVFRCISFKSSFIHNDFLKRVYNVCGDENELSKSVKQITLKRKKKCSKHGSKKRIINRAPCKQVVLYLFEFKAHLWGEKFTWFWRIFVIRKSCVSHTNQQ